jgi:hypothetical protein
MIRINVTEILIGRRGKVDAGLSSRETDSCDISLVKLSHRSPLKSLVKSFAAAEVQAIPSDLQYSPSKSFKFASRDVSRDAVSVTLASVEIDPNSARLSHRHQIYPPINYYWTGLLILDHSYLVGNLTNSKIAETKALEPLKS